MQHKPILGLDPGLRALGAAVLSPLGRILTTRVLRSLTKEPLGKRLQHLTLDVDQLLDQYRPGVVVLEQTWPTRNRALRPVRRMANRCRRLAARRRIPVIEVPVSTVRQVVAGNGWASKLETAQVVAAQFPELQLYLRQTRVWKTRHFLNLFDAVALTLWYQKTRPTRARFRLPGA